MSYETVLLDIEDHIATLTLNRPESRNSMTRVMAKEVRQILEEIGANPDVRVLVITGAGKGFCSGFDLRISHTEELPETDRRATTIQFYKSFLGVRDLEIPTIAMLNGHAMGAGLTFALGCDIRIAAESAKFGLAFIKIGLHPGMATTYLLPRLVGTPRALELLWTGEVITAAFAAEIGMVNKAVPLDELKTTTMDLAGRIARGPAIPMRMIKNAVYKGLNSDIEIVMQYEAMAQGVCRASEDFKEGVSAFLQKREAQFKGR
jgi:enoyl-CoA hydratase